MSTFHLGAALRAQALPIVERRSQDGRRPASAFAESRDRAGERENAPEERAQAPATQEQTSNPGAIDVLA